MMLIEYLVETMLDPLKDYKAECNMVSGSCPQGI